MKGISLHTSPVKKTFIGLAVDGLEQQTGGGPIGGKDPFTTDI